MLFGEMKNKAYFRILKYLGIFFIGIFALIGFTLTAGYLAVKFHFTDDPGTIDINDRYFQEIKDKYGRKKDTDSVNINYTEARLLHQLKVLSKYYPTNTFYILNAYYKSKNINEAVRMLEAVHIHMKNNESYISEINLFENYNLKELEKLHSKSVFEWMNINEWQDFKIAVAKDKHLIDSAAFMTGVEPRLIVAVLVGEQIRLFNSSREAYKKWIGPLKILSVETTFSLGVTGIKPHTAQTIEKHLKDSNTVFYLGSKYENLLDFKTSNHSQERFDRLTSYKNHYYSYLYAAINIKQLMLQWERTGFDISERPEILATLFNIGFDASVPKETPMVGGSGIDIKGKKYTFGAIAYEFYYSGELYELFPFKNKKFDFDE